MPRKKSDHGSEENEIQGDELINGDFLTSKQSAADALQMGFQQFCKLLRKYPFHLGTGVSATVNSRWHVGRAQLFKWFGWVQQQELRHPDSRRMRPQEPPDVSGIETR